MGAFFDPDRHDPADFATSAWEYGIEYGMSMYLMQYNVRLMNIATLYQVWEQQIRSFLYEELTRHHRFEISKGKYLTIKEFCAKGFQDIKDVFKQLDTNFELFISYSKINELRLLANVIKHGDGGSATQLKKLRPDIFDSSSGIDKMELYKTTLNEVVLEVDDGELREYGDALLEFWDEIPERMHLK